MTMYNNILKTIECKEKYKNSYLWSSGSNSRSRKKREQLFHDTYKDYSFTYQNQLIEVIYEYTESAKNVYFRIEIIAAGIKKDIRLLKKVLNDRNNKIEAVLKRIESKKSN